MQVGSPRFSCAERDRTILRNLHWLLLRSYTIHGETIVDPDGDGGSWVGLIAEPGFTPATR
jgi:hypothetical protein